MILLPLKIFTPFFLLTLDLYFLLLHFWICMTTVPLKLSFLALRVHWLWCIFSNLVSVIDKILNPLTYYFFFWKYMLFLNFFSFWWELNEWWGWGWVVTGIEAGTELFNDILSYLMSFAMAYFCFLFCVVTEWEITLIMKLVLFRKWQSCIIRTHPFSPAQLCTTL